MNPEFRILVLLIWDFILSLPQEINDIIRSSNVPLDQVNESLWSKFMPWLQFWGKRRMQSLVKERKRFMMTLEMSQIVKYHFCTASCGYREPD